jgi:murein DD-endopeptidase MepM/ murein hydrolase activator NlpD
MAVHTGVKTASAHSAMGATRSIRRTALALLSALLVACSAPSASTPTLLSPTPEPTPAATATVTSSATPVPSRPYLPPVDGECREYFDEENEHTNVWFDAGPGREIRAIEDGEVLYLSSLVGPPDDPNAPKLTGLALELADGARFFMIVSDDGGGKFNRLEEGQLVKRGDVVGLTGNAISYLGVSGPLVVTRPGTDLHCSEFSAD